MADRITHDFVATVKSLGYGRSVSESSVDWLLATPNPRLEAVLAWVAAALRGEHVVPQQFTAAELARLEELKRSGMYLTGDRLREAKARHDVFAAGMPATAADPAIRGASALDTSASDPTDVQHTEAVIHALRRRQAALERARQRLTAQRAQLADRLSSLREKRVPAVRAAVDAEGGRAARQAGSIAATLDTLGRAAEAAMCTLEGGAGAGAGGGAAGTRSPAALLSVLGHDEYAATARQFAEALAVHVDRQFHNGPARVVEAMERASDGQLVWLHSATPEQLLVHDMSPDQHQECQAELRRLQHAIPLARQRLAEAQMRLAAARARVTARREQQLRRVQDETLDGMTLQRRLADLNAALARARVQTHALRCARVPELSQELGLLLASDMVLGDSRLKTLRQDYNLRNQERVLAWLLRQHACHRLLTAGYALERRRLALIKEALHSSLAQARAWRDAAVERMARYERVAAAAGAQGDGAPAMQVAPGAVGMQELCALLHDWTGVPPALRATPALAPVQSVLHRRAQQRVAVSWLDVAAVAQAWCEAAERAGAQAKQEGTTWQVAARSLRSRRDLLWRALLHQPSAAGAVLTPPALSEAVHRLEGSTAKLSQSISELLTVRTQRAERLARDARLLGGLRQLFVWFHCDPAALRKHMRALRAEAQGV